MKFGIYSVSTPEYGIRETASLIKELGYDAVEWRVAEAPPEKKPDDYEFDRRYWSYNLSTIDIKKIDAEAAEIGRICSEAGIDICSLTTSLGAWDMEDIERVMKAANIMNVKNIRVCAPSFDEKENYRTLFERTVKQVKIIERLAEKYCVRANFEMHMWNIIPSASAAFRLVQGFNPEHIGVIYDPGNMVYEGFENYKLGIDLLGEYLAHVHIKNGKWELSETTQDGVEIWKPTWSPFKKGFADIKKFIRNLQDVGYKGYVSVEDFSNTEDTYSKLKNNIEFLRSISS